ncbi:hypothetical protein BH24GEM3_BH24GEM3_16160 [soil metagenome]|nr:type II toxin-antitoxin system RelE/ParE family toxin [Gemmatimonadota bacterium]
MEHYDAEVPDLGAEFAEAVERVVQEITAYPELGSPYLAGTRRRLVRRFPFSVVYRLRPEEIVILAVAHQKRKPGYWRGRGLQGP